MPRTETHQRATINSLDKRWARSTGEFIENLRGGPAAVGLHPAATWSRGGLPARLRRAWSDNGLMEQQLMAIEQALSTPGLVVRPIDVLMNELTQAVAQIASGVQDEAEVVLHPPAGP